MRAFRVTSASADILFHDLPGPGAPLVFIHGLGCASSCDYPAVAADPALAGRRALLIDLLGSGYSERPPDFGYAIDAHAGAVAELLRSVSPGPACLFGHSMGGTVAIALAAMLGDDVEALILAEPNLDPGGGFFSRKIAALSEDEYVARGHAETVAAARRDGNVVWAGSLASTAPYAVHRASVSLVEGSRPSWRETLSGLRSPKTVIFGERSLPDPDVEQLPGQGCRVYIVPEAGHSMAWDNPGGLAAAIRRALP